MQVTKTSLPEVLVIENEVHFDNRGFFFESFNRQLFAKTVGFDVDFVQDNHSHSAKGVLRGLHYQIQNPQGKLVRVVSGSVFDVAVDLRKSSKNFGRWTGAELSETNRRQIWVPPGFAHGFLVLSESADFLYKTTDYWCQEHDRCIRWNDPTIAVDWPLVGEPKLSAKDMLGNIIADVETFE